MNEWNRGGRDQDQRGYGQDDWRSRSSGERWGDEDQGGREQRSFDDRNRGRQEFGQEWRGQGYGQGSRNQEGRGQDWRGAPSEQHYGLGRYGGGQRNDFENQRNQGYGGQGYSEAYRGGQGGQGRQQYGGGQQGLVGQGGPTGFGANERLHRVTEGEADQGMFANLGHGGEHGRGEHRGRGPKNYSRSDDRIREDVNDRLSDDSWLDASEIEVQVSSCEVTLTGTVQTRQDKRRAEDLAEQVSGVRHVQNNLRVQQTGQNAQGAGGLQGQAQNNLSGQTSGQAGMTGAGSNGSTAQTRTQQS